MKIQKKLICCLAGIVALPVMGAFAETEGISIELITTFDYPGTGVSTQPQKINNKGDIAGIFNDASGIRHGFVRFRDGSFSDPITDPNDQGGLTEGRGINNARLVCGDYLDVNTGNYVGFFLKGGVYTDYIVPGSSWTLVLGVNDAGDFCGSDVPASGLQSGYVSINGTVTEFAVRTATNTLAYQINDADVSCGYWTDPNGITHGFFRESNGRIRSPIDPAGSQGTIVFGNNDDNWIVGRYPDSSGVTHAFLFIPPKRYITYDYPDATFTSFNGINNDGMITGRYEIAGVGHGILLQATRSAADQSVTGTIPKLQMPQSKSDPAPLVVEPKGPAY
jgi:hypothetical protein